jgi:hypothetical protein
MGLVPPKEGWVSFRSYNLSESLSSRALKVRGVNVGFRRLLLNVDCSI